MLIVSVSSIIFLFCFASTFFLEKKIFSLLSVLLCLIWTFYLIFFHFNDLLRVTITENSGKQLYPDKFAYGAFAYLKNIAPTKVSLFINALSLSLSSFSSHGEKRQL